MYDETWEEMTEAREVFFADDLDVAHLSIEERELYHQLAAAAEREELNAMWRTLSSYAGRYEGIALVSPRTACRPLVSA